MRRALPLFVASILLAGGLSFFVSTVQPKVYEAHTTLLVGQALSSANPTYNDLLASQRLSRTYADLATTRPLLENVIDELGLQFSADELASRVGASAPLESTLITLTVRDGDRGQAAAIANALSDELVRTSPALQGGRDDDLQESINADLQTTRAQIRETQEEIQRLATLETRTPEEQASLAGLEDRLIALRATYADLLAFLSTDAPNLVSIVEPAVEPREPVSPKPLLNLALGALAGLLLSAAVVFVVEYFDDAIKTPAEVQALLGLPTLGRVPGFGTPLHASDVYGVVTLVKPNSSAAESYRTIRTNIEFAAVDAPIRSIVLTSATPNEGKTVTAANLGVTFAQAGRHVMLVDADMRNGRLHRMFNLANDYGLSTLFRTDLSVDAVANPTDEPLLRVISSGPTPPNPSELLESRRTRAIYERLLATADLVIIDSPPAHVVADASIVSSFVDGTLMVVDVRRSRRDAVRESRESLARAGARVLGVVLNRTREDPAEYAEYYNERTEPADKTAVVRSRRVAALERSGGDARSG